MVGALAPGRVVERYRVEERLGEGGTAVVWRVRHVHLGTEHALKVMTLLGAQAGPRLLLEGRVQAGLRHPNIVAVTDVLEIDGGFGLLMEYVPPPSLGAWLQQNGAPPVPTAEALFRGIVEGVRHAHAHGLVHRDLKPANVLLARDPARAEAFVPKVADFGLARLLDPSLDGGHRHTRSGLAMGTPQYMAPEQFRDAKSVDRRADLFSLGCILHELLTGVPAFAWTDMIGVYEAMLAGRFPPLPDHVPARLRDAVAGCLVADRDARIPDCGTLLAVLDGAPHGATLVPRVTDRAPAAPVDAGATLAPRPFDAAATLVLPDPRTLSLPTLTGPEAPAASPPVPNAAAPPRRSGGRAFLGLAALAVAGVAAAAWVATRLDPVDAVLASPSSAPALPTVAASPPPPTPTGSSASAASGADLPSPEGASRAGTGADAPRPSTRSPAPAGAPSKRASPPNNVTLPTAPATSPTTTPAATTSAAPASPPAAAPAPAATTARARASGADTVWLVGPDGRQVLPATVTPGRYAIWADFGAGAVDAGEAALSAGDDVSVVCNASFTTCRVRR